MIDFLKTNASVNYNYFELCIIFDWKLSLLKRYRKYGIK